jgi:putative methyltransferase (TIGR04325 family)
MSPRAIDILKRAKTLFLHSLGCMRLGATPCKNEEYGFIGDYGSWAEAQRNSSGYDSAVILEKTTASSVKVRDGKAAYERDSVVFDEIQYAWPLLAGLLWVAAVSQGRLHVLDFGGALGTTYFQNRQFLKGLSDVRWTIVEQPDYVQRGRSLFENDVLRFYGSLDECRGDPSPQVILLSGVLQYLEKPYELLNQIFEFDAPHIIIDRTPFHDKPLDRLCVQRVDPSVFDASYPAWIFSVDRFRSLLSKREVLAEFTSFESVARYGVEFKGFIIHNRKTNLSEKLR